MTNSGYRWRGRLRPCGPSRWGRAVVVAMLGAYGIVGASAQSSYQIRAEDTINITVANQPDLTQQYVVNEASTLR